jgi:DNA-binding transcriptional MerR regulator
MSWTVGQAAQLARVSVRTLHHYDEIGLLSPSARSAAGYRLYAIDDLERLQQILFFRELGFPLDEIARILGDPAFERRSALEAQRALLAEKAARVELMLVAIDDALDALEKGTHVSENDMFDVFDGFDPSEYEQEVQERWGNTDAYKESARRTKSYTKSDWERFKAEQEANGARMIALFEGGAAPDSPEAMDIAEEARLLIDSWFYPLSHEMHSGLAEMYLADPRFTATYEKMSLGLAQWWHDAILANAARR